jgi:hypothetical protein
MSSADLKGALGALRRSWRAERAREQRVVVLDPGTDVGDWEQMVATLQRLERSGLVDAAGLLGWDVLVPCGEFLAQAAGLHAEHAGRGRVAAPALWRLCTASGTAGAAAAILAGGDVFDRADWDSAGGREGLCPTLRTMWAGTGAREADVADFLRRAATAGGPLVARAQGWLRASVGDASVGSSGGPSLGGASGAGLGHWSAGELRLEVPAASCPVTIEVVTAAGTGMVAPGVPAGSPELPGGPPDPPGGPSNPPRGAVRPFRRRRGGGTGLVCYGAR